jgi:hypothetical protein
MHETVQLLRARLAEPSGTAQHPERDQEEDMTRPFKFLMTAQALMLIGGAAIGLPAMAQPAPSPSSRVCLNNQDVVSATSRDGKTMIFKMRNGQTYINRLRGSCPGLRFNGFIWELRGINNICENAQTLRVIKSGEVCMLGKFDPPLAPGVKPPKAS